MSVHGCVFNARARSVCACQAFVSSVGMYLGVLNPRFSPFPTLSLLQCWYFIFSSSWLLCPAPRLFPRLESGLTGHFAAPGCFSLPSFPSLSRKFAIQMSAGKRGKTTPDTFTNSWRMHGSIESNVRSFYAKEDANSDVSILKMQVKKSVDISVQAVN